MSGKKKTAGWKTALLGLTVTAAVELAGILVTTLLVLRGILGEERIFPLLAVTALCAAFAGGLTAGSGTVGSVGALLNAALFGALLAMIGLESWGGVTMRGLLLVTMLLGGGIFAAVSCGKVGKRHGKRLVKTNKKPRLN